VPEVGRECRATPIHARDSVAAGVRGFLDITCDTEAAQKKIQGALDAIDSPPPTHRFHVAVLTASRKEGPMPELSAGEQKALNDFKKVMTFRSFETEAEAILQCDRDAQARLNGGYALELSINPNAGGGESIDVRHFQLRGSNPQTVPGGTGTYYPSYLETSFSIKKGETIVLGTSTTDQAARVVLVTALP